MAHTHIFIYAETTVGDSAFVQLDHVLTAVETTHPADGLTPKRKVLHVRLSDGGHINLNMSIDEFADRVQEAVRA